MFNGLENFKFQSSKRNVKIDLKTHFISFVLEALKCQDS